MPVSTSKAPTKLDIDRLFQDRLGVREINAAELLKAFQRAPQYDGIEQKEKQLSLGTSVSAGGQQVVVVQGGSTFSEQSTEKIRKDLQILSGELLADGATRPLRDEITNLVKEIESKFDAGITAVRARNDHSSIQEVLLITEQLIEHARTMRETGQSLSEAFWKFWRLANVVVRAAKVLMVALGESLYQDGYAEGGRLVLVSPVEIRELIRRAVEAAYDLATDGAELSANIAFIHGVEEKLQSRSASLARLLQPQPLQQHLQGLESAFVSGAAASNRRRVAASRVALENIAALVQAMYEHIDEGDDGIDSVNTAGVAVAGLRLYQSLSALYGRLTEEVPVSRLISLGVPSLLIENLEEDESPEQAVALSELVLYRERFISALDAALRQANLDSDENDVIVDQAIAFDAALMKFLLLLATRTDIKIAAQSFENYAEVENDAGETVAISRGFGSMFDKNNEPVLVESYKSATADPVTAPVTAPATATVTVTDTVTVTAPNTNTNTNYKFAGTKSDQSEIWEITAKEKEQGKYVFLPNTKTGPPQIGTIGAMWASIHEIDDQVTFSEVEDVVLKIADSVNKIAYEGTK